MILTACLLHNVVLSKEKLNLDEGLQEANNDDGRMIHMEQRKERNNKVVAKRNDIANMFA